MSKITQLKSLITLLNEFKMIGATNQHGVTRCVYDEHWILAQKNMLKLHAIMGYIRLWITWVMYTHLLLKILINNQLS